ncbi:MAG: hypothetical protein SNJ82_01210 [Gemmataceae bacterium]
MKRILLVFCTVLSLTLTAGTSQAGWGHLSYSGYQPWWNIFAKRYKCLTPEEERLQKFWHDYYSALKDFYCALDRVDWVAYYKNHGYAINAGPCGTGGCGRINYAPVFVSPTMQWAIPAGATGGPPVGPGYGMVMGGFGGPVMGGMPYGPMPYGPVPHGGMMPPAGFNPGAATSTGNGSEPMGK